MPLLRPVRYCICPCYAMSGTAYAHVRYCLCPCYALAGTAYAPATPCPVLTQRVALRGGGEWDAREDGEWYRRGDRTRCAIRLRAVCDVPH
eukprot:1762219-Rhodomonas_salina.2